jgi:tetratricopeptide (TPR) repeat protein
VCVTLLLAFAIHPAGAQLPPLAAPRRAELEAIVAKNQSEDTAATAVDIACLVNDLFYRKQVKAARALTSRLTKDIELLPDAPFEDFTYCAFEQVVGNFEKNDCDQDAQRVLAACFNKQARAHLPQCTSPVAITDDWFFDAFRQDPVKREAAKELWLSTIEKINGPNSDATAFVCDSRAQLLQKNRLFGQAMLLIERTACILERKTNPANSETIGLGCLVIAQRGLNYQNEHQYTMAERAYKIAIELGNTLNPAECKPVEAELWLAQLYAHEGRMDEAKATLQLAGDETAATLHPKKKYLEPYLREAIRECIVFEDFEVPLQFLSTAIMFSQQPDSGISLEQQLTNAFARLDNGKLACEMQEQVIAYDKKMENNSRAIVYDLEYYGLLQELKKKHVRAVGDHNPDAEIFIQDAHKNLAQPK